MTAAAGAFGAAVMAAFAPAAHADEYYYVPDPHTFDPSQVSGTPPSTPLEASGTEDWSEFDATTNTLGNTNILEGQDTYTQFGSYTNDLLGIDGAMSSFGGGDFIDYTSFGGGYANEFVDVTAGFEDTQPGLTDLLITPFGNFELFGNFFTS